MIRASLVVVDVAYASQPGTNHELADLKKELGFETHLEGVVDEPLQGGEGTNHNDPWSQSLPGARPSQLLEHAQGGRSLLLVQFRDNGVGGM